MQDQEWCKSLCPNMGIRYGRGNQDARAGYFCVCELAIAATVSIMETVQVKGTYVEDLLYMIDE